MRKTNVKHFVKICVTLRHAKTNTNCHLFKCTENGKFMKKECVMSSYLYLLLGLGKVVFSGDCVPMLSHIIKMPKIFLENFPRKPKNKTKIGFIL